MWPSGGALDLRTELSLAGVISIKVLFHRGGDRGTQYIAGEWWVEVLCVCVCVHVCVCKQGFVRHMVHIW